jgi:hypothetical protein
MTRCLWGRGSGKRAKGAGTGRWGRRASSR